MKNKDIEIKNCPITIGYDLSKVIGTCKFNEKYLKKINEDSVFSIGYIEKEKGIELIEISLTNDDSYKKYLDKKYKNRL